MKRTDPETISRHTFIWIKAKLLAIVGAVIGGLTIFILTAWSLLLTPSPQHLHVLSNYFFGYSVTWVGSVVGLLYGSLVGAVIGWTGTMLFSILESRSEDVDNLYTLKERLSRREMRRAA